MEGVGRRFWQGWGLRLVLRNQRFLDWHPGRHRDQCRVVRLVADARLRRWTVELKSYTPDSVRLGSVSDVAS